LAGGETRRGLRLAKRQLDFPISALKPIALFSSLIEAKVRNQLLDKAEFA